MAKEKRRAASPSGPLAGIRVVDLSRLAPGPYCTMLLADLGADVVVVGGGRTGQPIPAFARGKRLVTLDMKSEAGRRAFLRLADQADVVVEGFRPGVAVRLGAGYEELSGRNPGIVYCSLTGYGQGGPLAQEAGHDINYLAVAGVLGAIGPKDAPPIPPLNLIADFAGGSLLAAFGIVAALVERARSGRGQSIDAAMIDGSMSMMAMHFLDWGTPQLPGRGRGLLAGEAPYYRCYECADGRHISVGALEDAFFAALWRTLGLPEPVPDHMNMRLWPEMERRFAAIFRSKPRDAWAEIFMGKDACVAPVLGPDEVASHPHTRARHGDLAGGAVPAVPLFSRTPGKAGASPAADDTENVLAASGLDAETISAARPKDVAGLGFAWPPPLKDG